MTPTALRPITFSPPCALMSLNDRLHWRKKAEHTKAWRIAAFAAATNSRHGHLLPACVVTVVLPVKGNRRRDPHNYFATVKPIIDGLVDARCWPDDTPRWVTTTEPRLDPDAELVTIVLVLR